MILYAYDDETGALIANAELTVFLEEDETLRRTFNALRLLIKELRASCPVRERNSDPVYFINQSRTAARLHSALDSMLPEVVAAYNKRYSEQENAWAYGERIRSGIRHATSRAFRSVFGR